MSVLYDQMTSKPFEKKIIKKSIMSFKNQQHMQQIVPFLKNLNTKFERPFFGLTSHKMSMCSVVLTPHKLKIV